MATGPAGGSRQVRRGRLIPGDGPLARVPAWVAFVVVLAVLLVAVLVGGLVGAVLLGLLALGVVTLLAATWPLLRPGERVGRLLVLAVLVGLALAVALR